MPRHLAALFIFASVALAPAAFAQTAEDFVYTPPMRSDALNGNMFTNETEILTPGGIVDSPAEQYLLMQQPAAGPEGEPLPESVTETSPTIPPDTSGTAPQP